MIIKYLDLKALNAKYNLKDCISEVVDSGRYLFGRKSQEFANRWAGYCGCRHCALTGNCLDALTLIFKAYNFQDGGEVIVPANTYIATILSITRNNLVPVLVEPNIKTYNIDPIKIEEKISNQTVAILPVHLYGRAAEMDKILEIGQKHGLKVVADGAQGHGARYKGKRISEFGDATAFSFYPGKNLGALGDAGAVVTNDETLYTKIEALKNYGSAEKYIFDYQGINSRIDEIQSAVLLEKLPHLDEENARRKEIAQRYITEIHNPNLILPEFDEGCVWHVFPVRTNHQNELQQYLTAQGIQTIIHYPIPPHKQKAYKNLNNLTFPITEEIHHTILSLPCNSTLTDEEVGYVIKTLNLWA